MVVFSLHKVIIDEGNSQKCAVGVRNQLVFIPVSSLSLSLPSVVYY